VDRRFILFPLAALAIVLFGQMPAAAMPAAVPLTIDSRGGVIVGVVVDGAGPFRFMLDTGSSRSIVGETLARDLAAPVVARSEVVTSAGSDMRLVVRLASIALAGARVAGVLAPVLPDARLAEIGPDVRGVLGQDFLSAFNYTLDYRRRHLTWDESVTCDSPVAVPMTRGDGRFVMTLADERGAPLRLVPDSGAEMPVLFRRAAPASATSTIGRLRVGAVTMTNVSASLIERAEADADGLLPLHHFSAVSFAAGGACVVPRR
jgi:predicted aspartyl protease